MPGDATYVHLIDALSAQGPLWLFVAGLLILLGFVAVKAMPVLREDRKGRLEIEHEKLEISRQHELRRAEEARMRDDRDRENAANAARMVDAVNRQSDSAQAMASALNAITTRLDASQGRSAHMGEQVDEVNGRLGTVAQKVDEIHAATVRCNRPI